MPSHGAIMVVDDTTETLQFLVRTLTDDGYTARPADSGELALAAAAADPPDLILLDIRMPGIDGFEVCRRLKAGESTQDIPVIFISGLTEVDERVQGLSLGAVDFVSKPVQKEELLARVRTHLELHRLRLWLAQRALDLEQANVRLEAEIEERKREAAARRRAEEQLAELNAKLERRVAERTAEVQAATKELELLSYTVAHDLRSPLRALDGFSLALLDDYGGVLDSTGKDYLRRLRAASQRMAQLIDDLLMLLGLGQRQLAWERADLADVARKIVASLRQADPEREVELVTPSSLEVAGDPTLIHAALERLLSNAWKFTSQRPAARIELGEAVDDGGVAFFVRDNGAGFDPAYADKLFTPFQRLHAVDEYPGVGIGLAVVQRVVHRHGGRVWAEAEPGKGATFWFTLPEQPHEEV